MPYRTTPFVNNSFYHIYNRGVEKRQIFLDERDYERFIQTLFYYQFNGPKPRFSTHKRFRVKDFSKHPKIIEIVCYCLMPNHFHFLLKQNQENGIHEFLSKVINSYTKYFNTRYRRVGPLFQGQFKAVSVETDDQLLHLSRYIHLNPFVAEITKDWQNFPYSSVKEFIAGEPSLCSTEHILNFFKNPDKYTEFISNQKDYALQLARIQHLLIDIDD